MIQDIGNRLFDNTFRPHEPMPGDLVIAFRGWDALIDPNRPTPFPRVRDLGALDGIDEDALVYGFSIDETRFFLAPSARLDDSAASSGFALRNIHEVMDMDGNVWKFACATALHLTRWYAANRHCGRCGHELVHALDERALHCPACGNHMYPRINPAVIVAVTNDDKILMTRYANRPYVQRALIAGFCEIGERAEDTVRREVLEETGVRVKNIRYVGNQPWGMSGDLLLGFAAELDGSDEITIDTTELKYAEWVLRDDIFEEEDNLSLTRSLVMRFKRGEL